MKQLERSALICRLVDAMQLAESWAGETQIHKCVYFLQNLLDVPAGYDFILYKHGPFSFDLQRELASMMARLQLEVEPRRNHGPSFKLGLRGRLQLDRAERYDNAINFAAKELSTKDVRTLERLSTTFFVQSQNPGLNDYQIARRVNELKPHISTELGINAVKDVAAMRENAAAAGSHA